MMDVFIMYCKYTDKEKKRAKNEAAGTGQNMQSLVGTGAEARCDIEQCTC